MTLISHNAPLSPQAACDNLINLWREDGRYPLPSTEKISSLFDFDGQSYYFGKDALFKSEKSIEFKDFFGSSSWIKIESEGSIFHTGQARLAAPIIEMVALRKIRLGDRGFLPELHALPNLLTEESFVKLYAPQKLTLRANEICIGNAILVDIPEEVTLDCKKLTRWGYPGSEPSEFFEIAASWASDTVEIDRSCSKIF